MIFIISLDHQALDLVLEGADLVIEVGCFVGGDARERMSANVRRYESTKAREGKGLVIRAYLQAITERETPHARLFESIVSYDSIHVVKEVAEHIGVSWARLETSHEGIEVSYPSATLLGT